MVRSLNAAVLLARNSCRFGTLTPELLHILSVVEEYARYRGLLVVALSGSDGAHSAYSGHSEGQAVDLRCHDLKTRQARVTFAKEISARLGPEFYVTLARAGTPYEHIHAQLRRGVVFHPPPIATHVARFSDR